MYQVGFPVSAAFLVGYILASTMAGAGVLSVLRQPSRLFHIAATLTLGALWWTLKRHELRYSVLELMDTAAILFVSLLLSLMEALDDIRSVAVFTLALTTGIVAVIRAVIVPSSARRTFWLGLGASAVASAVFLLSSFHPTWPIANRGEGYWPMPSQVVSFGLWLGVLVSVAIIGSRIIYRLRREVRAARQLGQYTLGEKIGEGGMGSRLPRHARAAAPADRDQAAAARAWSATTASRASSARSQLTASSRHPNTVAIYDYGRTPEGIFYYAMEYLDGIDLEQLVEREGPLPPGARSRILAPGLRRRSTRPTRIGLVHRDIKPANIMLSRARPSPTSRRCSTSAS